MSFVPRQTHRSLATSFREHHSSFPNELLDGANDNGANIFSPSTTASNESKVKPPQILHRFRHDKSILVLVIAGGLIYAGTQGGEILVYTLGTYERVRSVRAHNGSVLGLCLSQDERLLFSSAGDRFVNVWDTAEGLRHLASIYSTYDVGDIFCISYSEGLETIYLGCQNTSIQVC